MPKKRKIIDFRARVPRRDTKQDEMRIKLPRSVTESLKGYGDIYTFDESMAASLDSLLASMEEGGVDRAVLHAEYEGGGFELYHALNNRVAEVVRRYPDRFLGFAGADVRDGMVAVRELVRAVTELGLKGLNLQPTIYGVPNTDKRLYPLFAKCVELDIPVSLHVGIQFSSHPFALNNPIYLDEIACDFPELKIVGMHGGWPWVLELIAVARKNPHVYLEFGAISPKYLALPRAGWEPIIQFANSLLQDRVLFGTDWPILPHKRMVEEFEALPLKEETKDKIFYHNTARLLGLTA